MTALERQKTWNSTDEERHSVLRGRFRRIVQQQGALRAVSNGEQPVAVAVNG